MNETIVRASLADVQSGGRVRLGDALPPLPKAGYVTGGDFGHEAHNAFTPEQMRDYALAALSAQPSPGGQGDALLESLVARWRNHAEEIGVSDNLLCRKIANCTMRHAAELQAVLAARQPVGEPVEKTDGEVAAQFFADHPALALRYWHEHIRRPLTHVPTTREASPYFECSAEQWERHTTGMTDGGKQRLANMVAHHCLLARRDDRGWIITRFDLIRSGKPWWHVSNDGVLTYDYDPATKERKVAVPPAQAVDLGAVRALLQRRIDQWRSHLPADPGAPGTREIETNGEHDYNNDVRIYREGIAVMEELLSKIDSQAVGNG